MDIEILQGFLKQTEDALPSIRGAILVCARAGSIYGELHTALRQIDSIKDAASIIGLDEIAKISLEFEGKLKLVAGAREPLGDEQARRFLDKLTELEAAVAKVYFEAGEFFDDDLDFLDESFEQLQSNKPIEETGAAKVFADETAAAVEDEEEVESAEVEIGEEEFEIDEEMLEIFAGEADELIRNINANLKALEKNPNERDALPEIRRSAHTLKGSAGIVGLKRLSKIAHRVEDLLDFLTEHDIAASEKIFELLLASTDCFESLARDEKSEQLTKKIERIYESFDETMAALAAEEEKEKKREETDGKIDDFIENPIASPPPPPLIPVSSSPLLPSPASPQNNRSTVRVSLEKLDDLVKIVGGLVISRSVFERRLAELEQQIAELHNSTRRLRRSTAKLETDFEADMLANGGGANSRRTFPDSPARRQANYFTDKDFREFDLLELDHYTEFHQTTRELVETSNDTSAINSELDCLKGNLETLFDNQRRLIEELQDKLLRLRMVSFGSLSARLHRTVRVTSDEEEKRVDLFVEGENLEVDTQILDSLVEPLLHLLRNAVAHGIEPPEMRRLLGKPERGRIDLRVTSERTYIVVVVRDDGRGISADALREKAVENNFVGREPAEKMTDAEIFQLMFLPGLTTAEKISQVSGRGVGMNIVKTNVERHQGTISIDSEAQKGTTFTVRLPMALAVARAILVKANEQVFAFPLNLVKHFTEISAETAIDDAGTEKSLRLGDESYTISYLNDLLSLPPSPAASNDAPTPLLLLETFDGARALVVDEVLKTEEIVIKPLAAPLQNIPELLGATILGDGSVVPVLDLIYLLKRKVVGSRRSAVSNQEGFEANKGQTTKDKKLTVLIVDDSPSVRHVNSNLMKNAGWLPIVARDGLEALEILQTARQLPEVILTDVEMPRMDGYELLASLKREENLRRLPVIMITSRTGDKHRQKAFDLGVSEYLTKPFDGKILIEKVEHLLADKSRR